jgi:hypothetical protein
MWRVTDLDYDSPLFNNAEARRGVGVDEMLWAKRLQRGLQAPTRAVKGGRGGQYAAKTIFEIRIMNLVFEELAIPASEAKQIGGLAAEGTWKIAELAADPTNWRSLVIFLLFTRTDNCWGFEILGPVVPASFKSNASLVVAAARELNAVSQYCWNILHAPSLASSTRDEDAATEDS